MARFGSLGTQYFDNSGDVLGGGKIYFYESGTTTLKNTYSDSDETIPNTNPVILTAAGRQPNIFFSGPAKAVLATSADVIVEPRDPVGQSAEDLQFREWEATNIYDFEAVVIGSDGIYYSSLVTNNVGNDPVSTPAMWGPFIDVLLNSQTAVGVGEVAVGGSPSGLDGVAIPAGHVAIGNATTALAAVNINAKGSLLAGNGTLPVALAVGANGTLPLANSAEASGIEWSTTLAGNHAVTVTTGNGHGSTNTNIRRYTTTQESVGTAITYADSATLGASFTINTTGLYNIYMVDSYTVGAALFGASVNTTQPTTNISLITATNRLMITLAPSANPSAVSRTVWLTAGDIVRPHTAGTVDNTAVWDSVFAIRKVAI